MIQMSLNYWRVPIFSQLNVITSATPEIRNPLSSSRQCESIYIVYHIIEFSHVLSPKNH